MYMYIQISVLVITYLINKLIINKYLIFSNNNNDHIIIIKSYTINVMRVKNEYAD